MTDDIVFIAVSKTRCWLFFTNDTCLANESIIIIIIIILHCTEMSPCHSQYNESIFKVSSYFGYFAMETFSLTSDNVLENAVVLFDLILTAK